MTIGVFSLVLALFAAGCDKTVDIKDGKVPAELTSFVAKYLGNYTGVFEQTNQTLTLSMNDNRLILDTPNDLLGASCKSKAGNLTKLTYSNKDNNIEEVTSAEFDFDPGLCASTIEGRTVTIEGKKSKDGISRLKVSILKEVKKYEHYQEGATHCGVSNGHPFCYQDPGKWVVDYQPIYLQGSFKLN